jgi:bifunctional DNA-binding transcriptional regulator/antitoxin component of YhaV-PrlF toxin-antitoxin module
MPAATLTEDGQIVIPADIRARYGLTAGADEANPPEVVLAK